MRDKAETFFAHRRVFFGDIHNHCGVSYGHGPLEDALKNAALQLDYVAVTGHAGWPDMADEAMPKSVVEYHEDGFERLRRNWKYYVERVEAYNRSDSLVTFFSYEYHSFRFGDRTVITPKAPPAPDLPDDPKGLEKLLQNFDARSRQALLLPHHIGYRTGYRGINWDSVTDLASPLIEIYSMHGLAELDESGVFPYMHTMGPLNGANTMQAGLEAGHHFGVTASTDHHSAHPGSYGYGRTGVWAEELSREAIWAALLDRRTYAVTGDRIELTFAVNGAPLGSCIEASKDVRLVEATVSGRAALDRVELVKNNRVIHRQVLSDIEPQLPPKGESVRGIAYVEFGWGEKGTPYEWQISLEVEDGEILNVEPRLRGIDVVDPLDSYDYPTHFSSWQRPRESKVELKTMTFGNATTSTVQTQGIALELHATADTKLSVTANGKEATFSVTELLKRSWTFYTGGFTSPAVRMHRFVTEPQYSWQIQFEDTTGSGLPEDWYYIRVFQKNGHAAWSSPVWVSTATS